MERQIRPSVTENWMLFLVVVVVIGGAAAVLEPKRVIGPDFGAVTSRTQIPAGLRSSIDGNFVSVDTGYTALVRGNREMGERVCVRTLKGAITRIPSSKIVDDEDCLRRTR